MNDQLIKEVEALNFLTLDPRSTGYQQALTQFRKNLDEHINNINNLETPEIDLGDWNEMFSSSQIKRNNKKK